MNLRLLDPGKRHRARGIDPDVSQHLRLIQGPVEDAVDVLDSLWREFLVLHQIVVHPLDHGRDQLAEFYVTDIGIDVQPHMVLIGFHRAGLHVADVVPQPLREPFGDLPGRGLYIGAVVDLAGNGGVLFPYILLGFAIDGLLNLFAGLGVKAKGVSTFPASF